MKLNRMGRILGPWTFLALSAALFDAVFVSGTLAQEEDFPLRYTVKFVCGQADGRVLGRGNYFTAINVHNSAGKRTRLQKMFTVALPGQRVGGQTKFVEDADPLFPNDSLEIDCEDIVQKAEERCVSDFCKGFVLIKSNGELEVVAVYTVADLNTDQVTTLHTDRVSPRCPIRHEVVPAGDRDDRTVLFVPPDVGGEHADRDFKSHGPCVDFRLSLEVEDGDKTLAAKYRMHAYECDDDFEKPRSDFTAAAGRDDMVLQVASPQGRILGHNLLTSMEYRYIDENHDDDVVPFDPPFPVEQLRFVGDTRGEEAGTKTGVFITFRQMDVKLETCAPVPPEDPIID